LFQIAFFAPNKLQHHAVNHINGETDEQDRNVLIESGRIARGKVHPLSVRDKSVPGSRSSESMLSLDIYTDKWHSQNN